MEAAKKTDDLMTSAAAFVEGGVQEACEDACSICLEDFSIDPSTATNCKHEFHLQCILEWCQRSSNCPMCWQPISLRDAMSQELLDAVEEERNLTSRLRNAPMLHHPSLVDFDLRHTLQLPVDASEVELEEHIFQHLAAAMGRGRHTFRREGQGNRSSTTQGGQHPFFIFSTPNAPTHSDAGNESVAESLGSTSISHRNSANDQVPIVSLSRPHTHQASVHQRLSSGTSRSSQESQETGEQSDLQSFSESLRSRLNSWSMRYKESLSRNTRGWKERLFSRSTSMADAGSEVHTGIANVSRLMERLNIRENVGTGHATGSSNSGSRSNMNNTASD